MMALLVRQYTFAPDPARPARITHEITLGVDRSQGVHLFLTPRRHAMQS